MIQKTLVLKLGGQCNINCKHCHCKRVDFKFNPDILEYIKNEGFDRITFSGGEPLLYFDIIKRVCEYIGHGCNYKLVTNTTLLDEEKVKFFNDYNFHIGASYDGENNARDGKYFNRFYQLSKINNHGFAVLYGLENEDYGKLLDDIQRISRKYKLYNKINRVWLNFTHQTEINANEQITKDFAKKYCLLMCNLLESEMLSIKNGNSTIKDCPVLSIGFNKWVRKHKRRGCACMNENKIQLNIAGQFMLCPYGDKIVGDIYSGIDWDLVESYLPEKCKSCDIWESCENQCIANITDNECFISKVMNKHFRKLMTKYNMPYEYLAREISE